jgi:hypothetical protein
MTTGNRHASAAVLEDLVEFALFTTSTCPSCSSTPVGKGPHSGWRSLPLCRRSSGQSSLSAGNEGSVLFAKGISSERIQTDTAVFECIRANE